MAVNRKARAQSRNEVTLEGDSDRGSSKGTGRDYDGGVPVPVDRASRRHAAATVAGLLEGPEVAEPREATSTVAAGTCGGVGLHEPPARRRRCSSP